ncbi:MAG: hypothetical protein H6709_21250 [Kofleriaceae bacterium]|nr:hypothetical protein [Myxococcales bacterium]MCB9561667.1 hypothetical protein [Kofleriaceae bacterium]MCB9574611.1 hypothetical protein [Kofleriaceae bacterium]
MFDLFPDLADLNPLGTSAAPQPTVPTPQPTPKGTAPDGGGGGSGGSWLDSLGRGLETAIDVITDPVGAIDRVGARADLDSKFTVVPDDYAGPRTPNMVTADEYDHVVRTYSNIRLGRTDLKIDGSTAKDPAQYQADMMDDIGDIMQTSSGRTLIDRLSDNTNGVDASGNPIHHSTTLRPRLDASGNPDNSNAGESGNSSPGIGAPFADGTHGVGGDTSIAMNPNMDVSAGGGTWRSDVALYHEMVHAMHDTAGTTDVSTVAADDGVTRELNHGNLWGAVGEMVNPDPGNASDAAFGLNRYEHQAAGLGLYADDPITENAYRAERNGVAFSGQGLPGDLTMPQRDRYVGYTGTYTPFFGL